MYGGKIDDEADFKCLGDLVAQILTPAAFEEDYFIVRDSLEPTKPGKKTRGLMLPATTGWADFMSWVNDLPEREPPTYLGLPANAEKLLLVEQAKQMISNLGVVMSMLDEGEQLMADAVES
jgi:dynein heavy chain 1, cytosolic